MRNQIGSNVKLTTDNYSMNHVSLIFTQLNGVNPLLRSILNLSIGRKIFIIKIDLTKLLFFGPLSKNGNQSKEQKGENEKDTT